MERAQDEAFALGGQVAAALVDAQREQKLAAGVGQPVYAALSQALLHLGTARGHVVDGHKSLEKIARLFRIDVPATEILGYGDVFKYPPAPGGAALPTPIAA